LHAAFIILIASAPLAAQEQLTPASVRVYTGAGIKSGVIQGTARHADSTPVAKTTVRLRNVETKQIEQISVTSSTGAFTFLVIPDTTYIVELLDSLGRVVAVGDLMSLQAGEIAGTVVTLPSRLPALAGLFGDTAGSVLSAAAGTGITAIEPSAPPDSPSR
jgi:hypothetical protein